MSALCCSATARNNQKRKPKGSGPAAPANGGMGSKIFYSAVFFILVAGAYAVQRKLGLEASPLNSAYVSTYEIVQTFAHENDAFTQGLTFDDEGNLYESDGLYGRSGVRHVDVVSGKSKKFVANERAVRRALSYFARVSSLLSPSLARSLAPSIPPSFGA